jgi:DNA polymerase I-like protein with 3'-5' exonuclease and polymerase domains
MVGLAVSRDEAFVVPWRDEYRDIVEDLLRDKSKTKIGHNFAFDCAAFRAHGVREAGPNYDTLQAAALLWPPQPRSKADARQGKARLKFKFYSLAACALRVLDGIAYWKEPNDPYQTAFYEAAFPDAHPTHHDELYCALDVIYTFRLWEAEAELLKREGMFDLFTKIVAPASVTLHALEERGMYLDTKVRDCLRDETENELRAANERIAAQTQAYHATRIAKIAGKIAQLEEECRALSTLITPDSQSAQSAPIVSSSTSKPPRSAKRSKLSKSESPQGELNFVPSDLPSK